MHSYTDTKDCIAWHFEKNGLFSVKSAYMLALNLKERKEDEEQYSGALLGERKIWDIIWKANVPQKIRIFAWRVATNSLAVQVNRVMHHQATLSTCSICGVEDENTFHALVKCPKAYALLMAMRDILDPPGEEVFKHSGSDWFLILLDQLNATLRNQIIFIFWRAWHLWNDLIFGTGKELVSASANFVENYFKACYSNNSASSMFCYHNCYTIFGMVWFKIVTLPLKS